MKKENKSAGQSSSEIKDLAQGSGFGPVYIPDDVMRLRGSFYSDGLVEGYLRSNPYHYVPTGGGAVSSVDLRESAVTNAGVAAVARTCGEALRSTDVSCTTVPGDEGLKQYISF